MTRHTLHVTVADPGDLPAVIAAIEALGVPVSCPAHDARQRRRSRDEYLLPAVELMSVGTPWGRCVQLEAEIRRFETVLWPRLRDHQAPPEGCSALRSLLFRARRLGPLPTTAKQLRNITVKCEGPCDFPEQRVSCPPDLERGI